VLRQLSQSHLFISDEFLEVLLVNQSNYFYARLSNWVLRKKRGSRSTELLSVVTSICPYSRSTAVIMQIRGTRIAAVLCGFAGSEKIGIFLWLLLFFSYSGATLVLA
jgi:hypothetical protein